MLAAGVLAAGAGAAVTVKAGSYKGTTSETIAVKFKIAHRAIENFSTSVGYNGTCGQGGGPGFTIKVKKVKIGSTGRFSAQITLTPPVSTMASQKGKLSGRASGGKVTGKIVDLTLEQGTGCKTGYNVTFTARKT